MPQYDVTAFFYQLTYYRIGDDETVITYQKDGKSIFDYETLTAADTTLTLLTGNYRFSVDAFNSAEATARVLSYTDKVAVTADTTTLSFALTAAEGAGAATTGSVSVTVTFPANEHLTGVSAKLVAFSPAAGTVTDTQDLTSAVTTTDGTASVTYTKSGIAPGTYRLYITLTTEVNEKTFTTVIPELVTVAPGAQSSNEQSPIALTDATANTRYAISYKNADGTDFTDWASAATAPLSFVQGQTVTLPTSSQVAKTGYTFKGWYDNSSLTGTAVTQIPADTTGAKSFWAKWEANKYTVRFHKNTSASDSTTKTQSFTYDTAQNLSTLSALGWSRTDATFMGWATGATATAEVYTDGKSVSNLTSYAKWTANKYTVIFDSNSGSAVASQTVQEGTAATKPTDPTKEGWVFDGWATSLNASKVYGGETYNFATEVTANITLYARWRKPINLVKDLMGATSQVAGVIVYYGGTYGSLYGSDVIPTITGSWATFKGWYTEEYGQGTKITETMTVGDDAPSSVYGNWELSYSTGNIGDIVLQTKKYVTAENYKNGRNDYNAQNGGTRDSSLKEFSSTAVGVVCASGYMVHLSVISVSMEDYASASGNAKNATASGFESDWTLPDADTMKSIHLNRDTINASLIAANSTSLSTSREKYILEQSYWISTTSSFSTIRNYVMPDGTKKTAGVLESQTYYYCAVHELP